MTFKVSERDKKWWMNESDEKDECSGNMKRDEYSDDEGVYT